MKKLFSLIVALVAMTVCAQAQITDDFESYSAFTVDPTGTWTYYDGDGGETYTFQSSTFPNAGYHGSCIVFNPVQLGSEAYYPAHSGSQYLAIFNADPYTIVSGSTTNDWIISPAINFTSGAILTFYARELTDLYGAETMRVLYSTTGNSPQDFTEIQTVSVGTTEWTKYTYVIPANATYVAINCVSDDVFALFIDDISINAVPTEPTISVASQSFDFGTLMAGTNSVEQTYVIAYNLTEDITVTTTAPFAVSTDNVTFASTVSMAQNGGTLYIQYAPVSANNDEGTVTLSSDSVDDVIITLTGNAFECETITNFPYEEDFESISGSSCWQVVDANEDGSEEEGGSIIFSPYSDDNLGVYVYLYSEMNNADDWLISPELELGTNMFASFDYLTEAYPEKYSVYVIPEGATYQTAVNVLPTQEVVSLDWNTQNVDLSAFENQTVRLAVKVESDADAYFIAFDNFRVWSQENASLEVTPTSMSFSATTTEASAAQTAHVVAFLANEGVTVSVVAPFEVSLDGEVYGTSATIPGSALVESDLYVRLNSSVAGHFNGAVTLANGETSATITLSGDAFDCSIPMSLPFTEDFEGELSSCWNNIDKDDDGFTWRSTIGTVLTAHNSQGAYTSASYDNPTYTALTPDNWLITPMLSIPAEGATITWWVAASDPNYPDDHYQVRVSNSGANVADFTDVVYDETIQSDEWGKRYAYIPSYAGQNVRIAFVHNNCYDVYMMKIDDIEVYSGGVDVTEFANEARVYPNPANNLLNVRANANINLVEVFNVTGQKVASFDANDTYTQINTSELESGVYTIRIHTENGMINQKFTVAR